jgi:hypothetical protein
MRTPPATLDEVCALLDCAGLVVEPLVIERIVELEASREEIEEALAVDGPTSIDDSPPSNRRVAEVRALLAELLEDRTHGGSRGQSCRHR